MKNKEEKKKKERKRNRWTKRFKFFLSPFFKSKIFYDEEINVLGAGGWDLNPKTLSAKRHCEERELVW
jgi:hypothetical protein